jgi:hypothetical protein
MEVREKYGAISTAPTPTTMLQYNGSKAIPCNHDAEKKLDELPSA